jgi:hypothetical protein
MNRMTRSVLSMFALLVCLAAVGHVTTTRAQTRDKYLISAKAGGVNFVAGNVTVVRKGASKQQALTDEDTLEAGDLVTTGMGARMEVLLNPGSYLRVTENSEFMLSDTSLESLSIKLLRGSAIIEAVGGEGSDVHLKIETPQTYALLVKDGIYRINVLSNMQTEILVLKGRAEVGQTAAVVKGGKKMIVGNGNMELAKLNKKNRDTFDLWSHDRAEYLASLNRSIPSYLLNQSYDRFYSDPLLYGGYSSLSGIWFRAGNCYVFVPTYYGSWASPYGYSYPSGYRRCCGGNNNGGGGSGGGTVSNNPPTYEDPGDDRPRPGRRRRNPEPSTDNGGNRGGGGGGRGSGGSEGSGGGGSRGSEAPSAPAYRPEPSAPSSPAPAPAPPVEAPRSEPVRQESSAPTRIETPRSRDDM